MRVGWLTKLVLTPILLSSVPLVLKFSGISDSRTPYFPQEHPKQTPPGPVGPSPGGPRALGDLLRAQYKLAKLGSDSTGLKIIEAGTVLVVHGKSLFGTPPGNDITCSAVFQDGKLNSPGFCAESFRWLGHYLDDGEKVYPWKIDVRFNGQKARVTISVIECDSCNRVTQPSFYKSSVAFDFPKDYTYRVDAKQADHVISVISQVLTIEAGNGDVQQQNLASASAEAPDAPPAAAAVPLHAPLQTGQMISQLLANTNNGLVLVTELGEKKIYKFSGLRITFVNGKVTDVQ